MGTLKIPTSGFIFASLLFRKDLISFEQVYKIFSENFGNNNLIFQHNYFPMLDYYFPEMGGEKINYQRIFIVNLDLNDRMKLKTDKIIAQKIEETYFIAENKRALNFDIGLVTLENLQLATSKNFTHRIYLGDGVYSDLTLIYQKNSFEKLPWSYPDYSHHEIIEFFNLIRETLFLKLKN